MQNSYMIYTFLLLIISCNNSQQNQNFLPPIACPNYFQYLHDGLKYIGRASIPNLSNSIELMIHFTQRQSLQTNYYGKITLESRNPLSYLVEFPSLNEVPKLTKITVNGQDICISNDYPPPSTRLFLNHNLQISTQPLSLNQPQIFTQNLQQTQPQTFNQFWQQSQPNPDDFTNFITVRRSTPNRFVNTLQPQPQQVPQLTPTQPNYEIGSSPAASSVNQPATQNGQCGQENTIAAFVFGGDEVMRGQFPWLTAIYVKSAGLRFICGGSLVSARTVVSAAHCFQIGKVSADRLVVNLGRHNLEDYSEGFVTREIQKLIIHPEYSANIFPDADLAVLHLQQAVQFTSNILPICLWSESSDFNRIVGQTGVVAGWGADETGLTMTVVPKKVNTNIVSESECLRSSQAYNMLTSPRTFCAGNRDGTGPCMGDSGSGLMINRNGRWYLRGIVSAGQTIQQRCNLQEFVVFCDVAKHLQWMQSQMVS